MKAAGEKTRWLPPAPETGEVELPEFLRPRPLRVETASEFLPRQADRSQPAVASADETVHGGSERPEESRPEPAGPVTDEGLPPPAEQESPAAVGPETADTGQTAADDVDAGAAAEALEELTAQLAEQKQQLAEQEQRLAEREARLAESLQALAELLESLGREIPAVVVDTALAAAERLLHERLEHDPGWVLENASQCLERIGPNGPLRLRLHPQDVDLVAAQAPDWLRADGSVELVPDRGLERGDCLLESTRARVDARLATQLESLRPFLEDALAHWLARARAGAGEQP